MLSRGRIAAGLSAAVMLCVVAPDAGAAITCGKTITKNVKLKTDLIDCPADGLVVNTAGVTIDLNGHKIDGQSGMGSEGIRVSAASNVVIKGPGRVTQFEDGILLLNAGGSRVKGVKITTTTLRGLNINSSDAAVVKRNVVKEVDSYAIAVNHSADSKVTENVVVGPVDSPFSSAAITVGGSAADDNLVAGNELSGGGETGSTGVYVNASAERTTLEENTLSGFSSYGIFVYDNALDTFVKANEVDHSGSDGIRVDSGASGGTKVYGNETRRNGSDGIEIAKDGVQVKNNDSRNNDRWGILATPAVLDFGGNSASGNGLGQCSAGISC